MDTPPVSLLDQWRKSQGLVIGNNKKPIVREQASSMGLHRNMMEMHQQEMTMQINEKVVNSMKRMANRSSSSTIYYPQASARYPSPLNYSPPVVAPQISISSPIAAIEEEELALNEFFDWKLAVASSAPQPVIQ